MPKTRKRGRGWFGESVRHALAARSIETAKVTPTRIDDRAVAKLIKQEKKTREQVSELTSDITLLKRWEREPSSANKPLIIKMRKIREKQRAKLVKQHEAITKQLGRVATR